MLAKGLSVSRDWEPGAEAGQRAGGPEAGVRASGRGSRVAEGEAPRAEEGLRTEEGEVSGRCCRAVCSTESGAPACQSPENPGTWCGVIGEERRFRRTRSGGARGCAPSRRAGALPSAGSWRQCRRG